MSHTAQLFYLIQKVTEDEEQTIVERLQNLNVLINSLKQVEKNANNKQTKAYLNGLNIQFLISIHRTLDLVEWMCESNYNSLELN